MKEILLATHNIHKKEEFQHILGKEYKIKSLTDVGILEEILEDGDSFMANAKIKAKYCFTKTGIPCIGDDSGLVVEALDGRPGIRSARYAGDHDFKKNITKVLTELEGNENRNASLVTVLCYYDQIGTHFFEGKIEGKILRTNKGLHGFGYDPIFMPNGYPITFAEMTTQKKSEISHRKIAIHQFLNHLESF